MGRPPSLPDAEIENVGAAILAGLSLEWTAYMLRDQLSWIRFCTLGSGDRIRGAKTQWDFHETLQSQDF